MTVRRSKWFAVAVLSSALLLGCAGAQPQSRLQAMTAAESSRLEPALQKTALPDGANAPHIDARQSFHLVVGGKTQLTLISVQFSVPHGAVSSRNCGIYLQMADGSQSFFNPVSEDLPIVCEGIAAVRLRRDQPHPAFIITGNFTSGGRGAWQQRFTISWDRAGGKYTMDTTGL